MSEEILMLAPSAATLGILVLVTVARYWIERAIAARRRAENRRAMVPGFFGNLL